MAHVIRQQQLGDNWCWAACASMAGEYITGIPMEQVSIVWAVKNTDEDFPAFDHEMTNALCVACNYQESWGVIPNSNYYYQDAVASLDSRKIFVIHFQKNVNSWHYVVCSGYDLADSKLRIIDPWNNSQTKLYKYSDLRNGIQIQSCYGYWNGNHNY